MLCADYTDIDRQNFYFEGYIHDMEVTKFFVWNFFDELVVDFQFSVCQHHEVARMAMSINNVKKTFAVRRTLSKGGACGGVN